MPDISATNNEAIFEGPIKGDGFAKAMFYSSSGRGHVGLAVVRFDAAAQISFYNHRQAVKIQHRIEQIEFNNKRLR
jgi:hypothetical protein